jgi:hypothetical protein
MEMIAIYSIVIFSFTAVYQSLKLIKAFFVKGKVTKWTLYYLFVSYTGLFIAVAVSLYIIAMRACEIAKLMR